MKIVKELYINHHLLTFSLHNVKYKIRLIKKKKVTHSGELRHWLSWRKHPLKCWNYVLIFLLSSAPMLLGNCLFAAAATAELNHQGISLRRACYVLLVQEDNTTDFCCIMCLHHHQLGHCRAVLHINFLWGNIGTREFFLYWEAVNCKSRIKILFIMDVSFG